MPSTGSQTGQPRPGDTLSIDLALLDDNPFQPRKEMDAAKLDELAASIAQSGLLQPIAVRPAGAGKYQVVAGHRRTAAFRNLHAAATTDAERRKYELIRAHVVAAVTDAQMAVAAYVENTARADLSPLEEAAALAHIRELGGHATATQVAEATAQPERRVRRLLALFVAPQVVKDCVSAGLLVEVSDRGEPPKRERRKLDLMAALEFARLHEFHAQKKPATADERTTTAMARALRDNWGKRRIESYVDSVLNNTPPADPITDTRPAAPARSVPPKDQGTDERGVHEPSTVSGPSTSSPVDVCSSTSERFTLYLHRLKAASRDQLEAARVTIDDVRQLIEAQLQLKGPGKA